MTIRHKNFVTEIATRPAQEALAHFESRFAFETDCADVHSTASFEDRGFVLLDVRSKALFDRGHVPGATHIPQAKITEERLSEYPEETLFVVYCAGPHCNGSTRAAARIARLGRPVKEMIGGVTGWIDEGYDLEAS
ncbi:MAG: rhodanese-like domain-containing protein [Planctomycetota bacterium]